MQRRTCSPTLPSYPPHVGQCTLSHTISPTFDLFLSCHSPLGVNCRRLPPLLANRVPLYVHPIDAPASLPLYRITPDCESFQSFLVLYCTVPLPPLYISSPPPHSLTTSVSTPTNQHGKQHQQLQHLPHLANSTATSCNPISRSRMCCDSLFPWHVQDQLHLSCTTSQSFVTSIQIPALQRPR